MRPLRSLISAAVVLSPLLLPATSMAGNQAGCKTGPAITEDDAKSPRTRICTDFKADYGYCCTSGQQWNLKCVEKADEAYGATVCGRDAWTAIQIPKTQQYFPRDFNVVALDGYIMGIVDVDDPIAASAWVTAKYFSLNRLQREPWAVISNSVSLCSGTVSGNVSHPSATNTYNDKCALGNVAYNPISFGAQGNLTTSFFDFSAAKAKMWAMSKALSNYENQITAAKNKTTDTTLTFTGKYADINVFSVDAKWLKGTTSFVFNLPQPTPPAAPASVIVNIIPEKASASGTTALLMSISSAGISSSIGGQLGQMAPGNLLWNIPPTLGSTDILSNLTISSTGFVGTLLAPNTVVNLTSTNVTGTIVAQAVQMTSSEPHSAPYHVPASNLALSKQYIKHIVVIMQENRSFDHYFGTFAGGASGPPADIKNQTLTSCNDKDGKTVLPGSFKIGPSNSTKDPNFPHVHDAFAIVTKNAASGVLPLQGFLDAACANITDGNHKTDATDLLQVLGYHDDKDIPNYWKYAQNFVLQDRMFAAAPSWSQVEHTYMVSGWSADCHTGSTWQDCQSNILNSVKATNNVYAWNDITALFNAQSDPVKWRYYKGVNWKYNCPQLSATCNASAQTVHDNCFGGTGDSNGDGMEAIWEPLTSFQSYQNASANGTDYVKELKEFYADVQDATGTSFPKVSWIVPGRAVSEHANFNGLTIDIKRGQAYVTAIINAIMSNPKLWPNTAIFLSWDDWGGFYDHVDPPRAYDDGKEEHRYGIRVPGLLISAWARKGYIDHQTLSHDAYLKFMEDLFLSGTRLSKVDAGAGKSDNRDVVRENSPNLGKLEDEFDFSQPPRAPLNNLPCYAQ